MLKEIPNGFSMRRVVGREDWARVRALRYEVLAARGDIAEADGRAYSDDDDLAFNSATFLLLRNGRPAGSTRGTVTSPHRRCGLPAMRVFDRELQSIALDGAMVEASLTVVDPHGAPDRRLVLFHLLKAHMVQCAMEEAQWLVACVREDEIGFYRRMLDMEILSGAERCPGMGTPRVLMGLRYPEHAALLFRRIPLLAVTAADRADYAESGTVRPSIGGLGIISPATSSGAPGRTLPCRAPFSRA